MAKTSISVKFCKPDKDHSPAEQNSKEDGSWREGITHSDGMVWDPIRQIRRMFKEVHDVTRRWFAATIPTLLLNFAKRVLVEPVTVNVTGAGAANIDVTQEFEYVEQGKKFISLPGCLQKTAPPVLVFCDNEDIADDIHIYLLLKGVDAVAVHGGLKQVERDTAIESFRDGRKDVLIATDVAAKGLDFPCIEHVINFDIPVEIGNYVHRVGLTGRCGKRGISTTFITKNESEATLSDLKSFLEKCNQKIPTYIAKINERKG